MPSIQQYLSSPWAILPEYLVELQSIYAAHLRGERIDIAQVEARTGKSLQNRPQGFEVVDGVALVPLRGVIAPRMNMFSEISGGASSQFFSRDVAQAMDDDSVQSVALLIDSPGGSVDGTQTAANTVFSFRGRKPIGAFAEDVATSAAYWIASAADPGSFFASGDTTRVGSIGIVATHTDVSQMEAAQGVKRTQIVAGRFKRVTSDAGPLSETGLATIQAEIDHIYGVFLSDVARNRNVSVDRVVSDMADGRIFLGRKAVDAGLIDGVSSFGEFLEHMKTMGQITPRPALRARNNRGAAMPATPQEVAAAWAAENAEAAQILRDEGRTQELARVADIRSRSMPGYEALVEEMAADGKTTGPEAADRLLSAIKADNGDPVRKRRADAIAPIDQADGEDAPSPVIPARADGRPVDIARARIDSMAKRYQAEHPGTDYIAAVKAVSKGA